MESKPFLLEGKTALVLGASRGIGAASALLLARSGARVLLVARNLQELESVHAQLDGKGHEMLSADLSGPESATRILHFCEAESCPDIVIWNFYVRSPLQRLDALNGQELSGAIEQNCALPLKLYSKFLAEQKKREYGRWILISSAVAELGGPGQGIYTAVKASQEALIRTIAVEQGHNGITANIIRPGFIDTPGVRSNYSEEAIERLSAMNLPGRAGVPQEVAAAVCFLASEEAAYINGSVLPVDGGLNRGWFLRPPGKI